MSFLTRARPLTTRVIAPSTYYRSFSTTVAYQRGPVDAAKDTAKTVDRKAADAAIKGIETGEKVTQKVKETVGYKTKEGEQTAKEGAQKAKEGAKQFTEEAKEKAGEGKEKAQQLTEEAKHRVQ